jgi:predicted acylesterase/phospholipase RssA
MSGAPRGGRAADAGSCPVDFPPAHRPFAHQLPWIDSDGRRLVDGGLVSNVSTDVARNRGARSIVVLDCGLFGVSPDLSHSIVDILAQSVAIQSRQQVIHDLTATLDVPVVWLSGPELTSTSQLDFCHSVALAESAYVSA